MAAQTARSRIRHAARTGQAIAPRQPRRVSGPLRPLPAGAPLPRRRRGTTGVFERLRALPEHRVIDRLLRSRAWIWLIGVLLGGIVAMQVSLLKLNAGISRAVTTAATLERQNAALDGEIARLSSSERIQAAAVEDGMVMPAAGDVDFLHARPDRDAMKAVRGMVPPSDEATEVMENGGREPGVFAAPTTALGTEAAVAGTTTTTPDPAATSTTTPTTTTPTTTTPGTTTPATTSPPTDSATTGAGAVTAPDQG
jgi:cell division protein FtsL